ncbi:hypothetical protein C2E21_2751 [Chlorella sorokiniana]|uniref:Uncharacterized protein n=1 Tax=Chlorella sorokiniana TaxID=3076 RepID=A0A2P6TW41_CHLSO|nr:hypothetical protein C2E21_2751 [Chlorella sorokiniana]|eukprot:PRW58277.1 hypothetical protein C2E21_2751 [Chlorella sorokiniana]
MGGFLLLEPGPVAPDEPHQRGDSSLFDAHALSNIAQHVLSGRLPAADYQSKILCSTDWRRKGTAYDLAPLGNQMPASVAPEFRPLPNSVLQAAFTLQLGSAALNEADKGDLLPTNLGGFAPSATAGSAGTATAGGGGLATAGSVGAPTKIKLKVVGKKEKKRRRESSEPA